MHTRIREKIIGGKKRTYLVGYQWNKQLKQPRQIFSDYVDLWPKDKIEKLIALRKEQARVTALLNRADNERALVRKLEASATKLFESIVDLKQGLKYDLAVARRKSGFLKGKKTAAKERQHPKASLVTPFVRLTNRIGQLRQDIAKVRRDVDNTALKAQLKPIVEFYNAL